MEKSSKSIIWVLAIVLLLAAGIWAYVKWIHPEKVTSPVEPSGSKMIPSNDITPDADQSADWKNFENDKYGFSLELTDNWAGYRWEAEKPVEGSTDLIKFFVPTEDETWYPDKPGYASPFSISVYTLKQWDDLDKSGPHDIYIGENDTYVFAYFHWLDCPEDLCDVITMDEIDEIIKSFKIN